jgi:hypothetical protein
VNGRRRGSTHVKQSVPDVRAANEVDDVSSPVLLDDLGRLDSGSMSRPLQQAILPTVYGVGNGAEARVTVSGRRKKRGELLIFAFGESNWV